VLRFLYRCPNTGDNVQAWAAGDALRAIAIGRAHSNKPNHRSADAVEMFVAVLNWKTSGPI
jgi:hypothetical protein